MTIRDLNSDNRLAEFLNSAPRFKVVVLRNNSFDASYPHVNVGRVVAEYLRQHNLSKQSINTAKDFLSETIAKQVQNDEEFGTFICLTNLGVLFEIQLDFSPVDFLSNLAKNNILFIHWQGVIRRQILYFLDEGSRYFLDFRNINFITICNTRIY